MPIVQIHLMEGRDDDLKRTLVSKVTAAIVESICVPAEEVKIILSEMSRNHYAKAGILILDESAD
ncbi:MAG: 2-hydroxymuconate tautomerase [Candidatus Caenarcaniphilales bacterium]|nr:2-hydroxymuconate tautomerase [Candidatus Caenarcaniphilales bacterium]